MVNGKGSVMRPMEINKGLYDESWNSIFSDKSKYPDDAIPESGIVVKRLPKYEDKSATFSIHGCSDDYLHMTLSRYVNDERIFHESWENHDVCSGKSITEVHIKLKDGSKEIINIVPVYNNGSWSFAAIKELDSEEDSCKFSNDIMISRTYGEEKSNSETVIISVWNTNSVTILEG